MGATRMNISVPDDIAEQVRAYDLPTSSICQEALRKAVEQARKKEDVMTDIDTVVERLRGTIDDERQEHRDEGRRLGIAWAREWATATELRAVAESDRLTFDRGLAGVERHRLHEFYEEVEFRFDADYADEHTEGFIDGAREVWELVESRI